MDLWAGVGHEVQTRTNLRTHLRSSEISYFWMVSMFKLCSLLMNKSETKSSQWVSWAQLWFDHSVTGHRIRSTLLLILLFKLLSSFVLFSFLFLRVSISLGRVNKWSGLRYQSHLTFGFCCVDFGVNSFFISENTEQNRAARASEAQQDSSCAAWRG